MELLPKWVLPPAIPSVYDTESATAIEMVAKLYGAMNTLIEEYNEFAAAADKGVSDFTAEEKAAREKFEEGVTKVMREFQCSVNNHLVLNLHETATDIINRAISGGELEIHDTVARDAIAVESARVSALASLDEGSTTGDAELIDARTDFQGNTNGSAGAAIRYADEYLYNLIRGRYPVARYASYSNVALSIDTAKNEITVNNGYIFLRSGRWDVKKQTVTRDTAGDMSLLVFDAKEIDPLKRVKSVSCTGVTDNHIVFARLSAGYPTDKYINDIPGKWEVDGVVYPKDVDKPYSLNWYALGDSITRGMYGYFGTDGTGYSGVDTDKCWAKLAAEFNGWTLTNSGVSGSGYLYKGGGEPKTSARDHVGSIDFAGADLVTLAYGVNDYFNNVSIGSMADDVSVGGTFVSEMRYCIEKIMNDNPAVKIVVISPINTARGTAATNWGIGTANNAGTTLEDIFAAEKTVCEYYGIEFIDMLHSSVVNRLNITAALPDGVHPSRGIHEQLAHELSRKIMG